MRNKPRIRFKGFTEDWEQRKLIDIAKTFIGLVTTMTENYRDSGTLLIRNSDIKEGQFVFSENPIHLDEEFAEKNKTRRLQIGDVVTVHTGDIGTSAVIEEKEAGAIGFATINTRTDKSILNPYFLATYFNTEKHKCYANSVSTGDGRSNYNIKDFNKLVISVPTLDEQERISVLINDMNTIITLHQRKLEKLKLAKKALLQKLFPKNGSQFPEIRFKGFTDAWEQRKLRNLLEQPITDGPHETPELYNSGIPFISVDAIVDNKIDFTKMRGYISKEYDDICAKKYKPQINDVYLVKSGATIGKVAIVDTYDDFNIWSPLAAMRCGSITNPYFLYILLQTQDLQSQVFNKASHGTQPNLSMRQLEQFTCKVPKIEEQKLISRFLKQLDDVITLHQRKLDKLQDMKKGLLQKMFV